ncbi:hypothetical protein B0H14DRAFT_3167502 [Mycena olivaceomarginata]|nr:hypothetical protein B0H14DRAFT_3167502 [Mycena olivaceomarginata]
MPALTLPFLPPGLSPAASLSLAILPWLLLLLALGAYLARHQIVGGAKALLHALRRPARYYIHLAGTSSSDVLPTTAPAARSTSAQGHAPPPQAQGTLRGRGRARSKPGAGFGFGRNFGLSLGGRRAKSAGPVLPRFASDSREHLVSPHHGASAPASPGLQVPGFMHGDADAVPLVDLGPGLGAGNGDMARSWASLSSFSDIDHDVSGAGSQSHPHADRLLVDVSHVSAHEDEGDGDDGMQLVDLSHPHDRDLSHELVDVSVPPSPAAWAVAHPPPTPLPLPPLARPTPASTTPSFIRPAAVRPHAAAQAQAQEHAHSHDQTSASQIPDSLPTNMTITSINLPPPSAVTPLARWRFLRRRCTPARRGRCLVGSGRAWWETKTKRKEGREGKSKRRKGRGRGGSRGTGAAFHPASLAFAFAAGRCGRGGRRPGGAAVTSEYTHSLLSGPAGPNRERVNS